MFFNLETGEARSIGTSIECWMADGNLWISGHKTEVSISQFPVEEFCQLLDRASTTDDYIESYVIGDLNMILEGADEGSRNVCFSSGRMFYDFNMKVEHMPALAGFLREYRD
jgi:hypothetical protein